MNQNSKTRRQLLQAGSVAGALATLGMPALVKAQSDKIKIGHLTPLTGFLGPLGEYGTMGIKLAVDDVNKAGGVNGRQIELLTEDSVNPATAASKAQRMFERDGIVCLLGEINSASGLAISQVAARNKKIFINTGGNSDELRGKSCNKFMFHVECANSMYVNTLGRALLQQGMVKGKKWYFLTADYAFGHDLTRVARIFLDKQGGIVAGEDKVPTDATDYSAYLLKIRQAKPDVVISNLAGTQITSFMKQYSEYGLPFAVAGFGFDTALAWGAGADNFVGTWPVPWHHDVDTPTSKAFVAEFMKRHGKPPENQAWGDYTVLKIMAQAMNDVKSTDTMKVIEHLEKGAQFDILKGRKGYFRDWDHQLMQQMYTVTPKKKGEARDKWDFLKLGPAVPNDNEPLDIIAPTREENSCNLSV
jgi:branched-chain amino acid transport system substrate-binding protein